MVHFKSRSKLLEFNQTLNKSELYLNLWAPPPVDNHLRPPNFFPFPPELCNVSPVAGPYALPHAPDAADFRNFPAA